MKHIGEMQEGEETTAKLRSSTSVGGRAGEPLIDALRRSAKILRSMDDQAAQRVADGLERYFAEAPLGRTLDSALGLPGRGSPWWIVEQRRRRDEALREMRTGAFGNLDILQAAAAIVRQVKRRQNVESPATTRIDILADRVLRSGIPLPRTKKQVLSIICQEIR